jgi:hypothetical protein
MSYICDTCGADLIVYQLGSDVYVETCEVCLSNAYAEGWDDAEEENLYDEGE